MKPATDVYRVATGALKEEDEVFDARALIVGFDVRIPPTCPTWTLPIIITYNSLFSHEEIDNVVA